MPSTIVVPEAYMLKGRENFVEWDGFLNMFLPDDYASRVLIASIDPICSSDIIPIRQMKGTAHECWLELTSRYRPSDAQAAATLVGEFRNLPPIPTTESGFNQWAGHVRIIVNSMRNLNIDFEQILTARLLLNMPQLYNNWKSTFNQHLIFSLRREVRSMGEHPINGATPAYIASAQPAAHSQNRSNARSQRPNEASSPCPVCDEGKHWAEARGFVRSLRPRIGSVLRVCCWLRRRDVCWCGAVNGVFGGLSPRPPPRHRPFTCAASCL
ncbi:BZ3500_MvSof-1268-A1-R1_Chr3-3g06620 [Microbotryum saponariae]|uniref:BZ3500_MvSof-1268-A1-R1_Chr3-3g06620 protein n=1 Tax=Microbotryum saponariae TaxID=289078 RepID=A0A2X0KYF2_9BASI|nr:BZ3500_MvSof-1268-A1-R1_Chr3-3g06620 [Microbotryum saponariae]SDA04587.1 BZ3501_MvSof-1269-A2-R1_Chr3-2g06307 [Microbotryum saponariae]